MIRITIYSSLTQISVVRDGALGDACSLDVDGDGIVDGQDNCLEVANPSQSDMDLDGFGDVCDQDPDGDLLLMVTTTVHLSLILLYLWLSLMKMGP